MKLEKFIGPGSTVPRRKLWDKVSEAVLASRKNSGRNVTVTEHEGYGSVIDVTREQTSDNCLDIDTVTPVTIGSGYLVGEEMKPVFGTLCPPADNFAFKLHIDAVDGSGGVTAFTIIPLIGYLTPPSNPIAFAGTIGTGFTANCTFV